MASKAPCGNPDCSKAGTMKCSRCNSVSYCSAECQRKHWAQHKSTCKSTNDSPAVSPVSPTAPTSPASAGLQINVTALIQKLTKLKQETQTKFQSGDLEGAIKSGTEGIEVLKLLPEPGRSIELIQMHLNLSNACMQLKKLREAEEHVNLCVENAERLNESPIQLPPGGPQVKELLAIALGNKSLWLMNTNRLKDADEVGVRALELAEAVYPANDFRLFKQLRGLGVIRDRQDKFKDAEQYMTRAYRLLFDTTGPVTPEAHMVLDELVQMLVRRGDFAAAEVHSRYSFDELKKLPEDPATDSKEKKLIIGDSAARLASIVSRLGRFSEAEPLLKDALKLREAVLGPDSTGVAMTLVAMANNVESMNGDLKVALKHLERANQIFVKLEGAQSFHAMTTLDQVEKLRDRINDPNGKKSNNSNKKTNDAKTANISANQTSATSSSSTAASAGGVNASDARLSESDGFGRMRIAGQLYETGKYKEAEILIAEALAIFEKQFGNDPNHPSISTARQNLEVVRNQLTNKLWTEVITDLSKLSLNEDKTAAVEDKSKDQHSWLLQEPPSSNDSCIIS